MRRFLQVVDMMIAAIGRTLPGCTVVTTDSDLSAIPNLGIVNWQIEPSLEEP